MPPCSVTSVTNFAAKERDSSPKVSEGRDETVEEEEDTGRAVAVLMRDLRSDLRKSDAKRAPFSECWSRPLFQRISQSPEVFSVTLSRRVKAENRT